MKVELVEVFYVFSVFFKVLQFATAAMRRAGCLLNFSTAPQQLSRIWRKWWVLLRDETKVWNAHFWMSFTRLFFFPEWGAAPQQLPDEQRTVQDHRALASQRYKQEVALLRQRRQDGFPAAEPRAEVREPAVWLRSDRHEGRRVQRGAKEKSLLVLLSSM